jgi:hypothetical protein
MGANGLLEVAGGAGSGIPLRFATGFFLAGVYPPALKLMSTWFQKGRGTALGILIGALAVRSATPHLVDGLGGLDWRTVIYTASALALDWGLIVEFAVGEAFPFPRGELDPRQVVGVFANRGVRFASLGYFGHQWEIYAMWTWFLVFFSDAMTSRGASGGAAAAFAAFAVIGIGGLGCWVGGVLG